MATAQATGGRGGSTRGQHRRAALTRAASDLLLERGIAAISHRAVAARAELPLAATTYYFSSLHELTFVALEAVLERWKAAIQALVDRLPDRLDSPAQVALAVLEIATAQPADTSRRVTGGVMAMYERYLEAGRHAGLRPLVHAYNAELIRQVAIVLGKGGLPSDPATARLVLAVVDGTAIFDIAEGVAPATAVTDVLTGLLTLVGTG